MLAFVNPQVVFVEFKFYCKCRHALRSFQFVSRLHFLYMSQPALFILVSTISILNVCHSLSVRFT